MRLILLSLLCIVVFVSCSRKKLEITNEYIINENWSKENENASANSITINKMKVKKDSSINPFSELSQAEILNKLEEDTLFMHYANIKIKPGEYYKNKRIYFNRDNEFYWGSKSRHNSKDKTKTIGLLKPENWYRFSDLGLLAHPNHIYIYIDSMKRAHRFDVNLLNY